MNAEKPATGIMKTGDYVELKSYKVECTCGDPTHKIDFSVESNETEINVNTYVDTSSDYWTETFRKRYDIESDWLQSIDWYWKDFVNGIISRVKLTWNIWFHGKVRCEAVIIMSEQQALNYAETIKTAIGDLKAYTKGTNKL